MIREDLHRKGLLFAGTEGSVYVSFDDGDNWQPLQLNLPHTSMRDLAIHGDDLIVNCGKQTALRLLEVQPEARKRIGGRDLINGLHLKVGDRFGKV